jgi:hypothetical protein
MFGIKCSFVAEQMLGCALQEAFTWVDHEHLFGTSRNTCPSTHVWTGSKMERMLKPVPWEVSHGILYSNKRWF